MDVLYPRCAGLDVPSAAGGRNQTRADSARPGGETGRWLLEAAADRRP